MAPKPKSYARDGGASSPRNSIATAIIGVSRMSVSVAVPQDSKPASTAAPVASGAIKNSNTMAAAPVASGAIDNSNTMAVAPDIFSMNASKVKQYVALPNVGEDVETTTQLVACAELLARTTAETTDSASTDKKISMDELTLSQLKWTQEMNDRPLEKDYIQLLMNQMIYRFVALPNKTSEAIREIILLGPVLDKEHYLDLFNCFLNELERGTVLNTNLLQGLIRFGGTRPSVLSSSR